MNILEIDKSIDDIQRVLGFHVQNVYFYDKTLVLKLWQDYEQYHLVLSLDWSTQGIYLSDLKVNSKLKNQKKPLSIFANTHLKGACISDISRDHAVGRSVNLEFLGIDDEEPVKINVILIPSAPNISISKGKKSVSLNKPKELPPMAPIDMKSIEAKPLEFFSSKWESLNSSVRGEKKNEEKKKDSDWKIDLAKKKKALKKINKDSGTINGAAYLDFAQLLETDPDTAKNRYPHFYNAKKNPHKLKDEYFEKFKKQNAKRARVQDRVHDLEKEIESLESMNGFERSSYKIFKQKSVELKPGVKTRKFQLSSDLLAYFGKSAADNLKLLRSAKSWHLWFHIKDIPSSHMILFKDKARNVTDSEVQSLLTWFLKEVIGNDQDVSGYEVLMTECRYVKPIKGDKIGRVNYSHEKVIRVR